MNFKKIMGKMHLWLGLSSGLLICFLGITGCLLAFEIEIRKLTEYYRDITPRKQAVLPPSRLKAIAERHLQSHQVISLEYPSPSKAAIASYYDEDHYEIAFINPYDGKFLKHRNMKNDFFRVVLDGHFYLWLPPAIGQPIVASATLIFLIMIISGIILWWPRNKAGRKQRFSIKWSARWRRKNYDLHNVLGFYMSWVAIFLAITGLVMGFQWFAKAVYWTTSGGQTASTYQLVQSDTMNMAKTNKIDQLFTAFSKNAKNGESISINFPATSHDAVQFSINHRPGTYYKTDILYFDQYSGAELPAVSPYQGKYKDAKLTDKIARMNYDIHVGAVLGLPGKLLMFFASLIAASLPVTGFLIWWGRKKKKKATSPAAMTLPVISSP